MPQDLSLALHVGSSSGCPGTSVGDARGSMYVSEQWAPWGPQCAMFVGRAVGALGCQITYTLVEQWAPWDRCLQYLGVELWTPWGRCLQCTGVEEWTPWSLSLQFMFAVQ